MDNIRNRVTPFLNKYLLLFLLSFALLTLLPYVSFFKPLQAGYTSGLIYRGVLASIIGLFFIFVIFIYKSKLSVYIWICTGIYLISQIITIFVTPAMKQVDIPTLTTIMGLGQAIIISISVICYLTIFKYSEFDKKIIDIACLFMIFFGLLLCIYSYIFEWEDIYHTFNTIYGWNYDVTSIFTMKTEYGFTLYICSIFSIFYILNNKKYWMYIIPIFFLINMFISRSKTSILCTTIILITLLVVHIIQSWNKYKKYWIISFITVGIIATILIILTALKVGWFERFNYYITQVILGDAKVVMDDRIHKWSLLLKAMDNPFNIIFGYGERITPLVLSDCGCATIGDNIYLSNYGIGGIIKLVLSIALSILIIICSWRKTSNKPLRIIVLIMQISFLMGGLSEDDSMVGITMSGLFSSILFYSCNKMIRAEYKYD